MLCEFYVIMVPEDFEASKAPKLWQKMASVQMLPETSMNQYEGTAQQGEYLLHTVYRWPAFG